MKKILDDSLLPIKSYSRFSCSDKSSLGVPYDRSISNFSILTEPQTVLKNQFANYMREKAEKNKIQLEVGKEYIISEKFLELLIQLKKTLENGKYFSSTNSNIMWTTAGEEIIIDLSRKLATLFSPIGGCGPNDKSAYWCSNARKQAEEFGKDFANTPLGSFIDHAMPAIQRIFTPNTEGKLEKAFVFFIWSALSKLYAEGTINDAYIFLIDGEVSCHSIFWNVELFVLRKRQHAGDVNQLYLYILTPEALQKYQLLLKKKKECELIPCSNEDQTITNQINDLLKEQASWHYQLLDISPYFKIRTNSSKTISFKSLKEYARHFYKHKNNLSIFSPKRTEIEDKQKQPTSNKKMFSVVTEMMILNNLTIKKTGGLVIIANYLGIQEIKLLFKKEAREYRKKTPILARHVRSDELKTPLITYISDPDVPLGYKAETTYILSKEDVIVRNIIELRDSDNRPLYNKENKLIYNDYAMPITTFEKNYGDSDQLSDHFNRLFLKKKLLKQ